MIFWVSIVEKHTEDYKITRRLSDMDQILRYDATINAYLFVNCHENAMLYCHIWINFYSRSTVVLLRQR